MLDKKQALATMDVHIVRAEAERQRRLERRTGRFTTLYPSLRWAPLEAREDLVSEASRNVLRSWLGYTLVLVIAATVFVALYAPAKELTELNAFALASATLAPMALVGIAFYLRIRFYLRGVVASRYKNDCGSHGATGA